MRALRPHELLAIEPGNLRLESARHLQFHHLHVADADGREWFTPSPELTEHIATMARVYPMPSLADLLPEPLPPASPLPEPVVPAVELAAALARHRSRQGRDLDSMTEDELVQGIRDAELMIVGCREWSGRIIAMLRLQGASWSQLTKSMQVPHTTLWNRARKYLRPEQQR